MFFWQRRIRMNKLKNLTIPGLLVLSLLLLGCGNKGEGQGQDSSANSFQNTIDSPAQSAGDLQMNVFISGGDTSQNYFKQGAELGGGQSSTNALKLQFLTTSGGSPEALKSSFGKSNVPAVVYWSVDDITPVASSLSGLDTVGIVASVVDENVIKLGSHVFGFGYSTELTYTQLAKFAGKVLKSYRFGILTASGSNFELQSKAFIEESKSLGNTIVFEERVTAGYDKFNAVFARATAEKCDTLVAILPASELVRFIKEARSNQFKGKIIVGDALFASDIATLGQDAEGIYFPQAWSDDAHLKSIYASKFGGSPDGISLGLAALGFDLVNCLQRIAPPLDAYNIKSALLSNPCEGLTGKTQFTGERIAQRRKVILTVKGGQIVKGE